MYLIVTIIFSFISYIVDNIWTHDKDLPAIRNEQGHYNNQVRIKTAPEGIMLIKHPREDNLIQAAAAKGQLISKCPFGFFKSSKKTTFFFPIFLPYLALAS